MLKLNASTYYAILSMFIDRLAESDIKIENRYKKELVSPSKHKYIIKQSSSVTARVSENISGMPHLQR